MRRLLLFITLLLLLCSFAFPRCSGDFCSFDAHKGDELCVSFPLAPLAKNSLHISSRNNNQKFVEWTSEQDLEAGNLIKKISRTWENCHKCDAYLVYGKTTLGSFTERFHWEIVPFPEKGMGAWQRMKVIWNVTFGPKKLSDESLSKNMNEIRPHYGNLAQISTKEEAICTTCEPKDAFCKPDVIKRQNVFTGEHVYVLLDYTTFRLIGDKPHFLIVPKRHCPTFQELTKDEYLETMALARKIALYFAAEAPTYTIYLFHKNGERAGQSVPHWHLHLLAIEESGNNIPKNGLIDISSVRGTGLSSPFYRAADDIKDFYTSGLNFLALVLPRYARSSENLDSEVQCWREKFAVPLQ